MSGVRLEELIAGAVASGDWAKMSEAERIEHVKRFGDVPEACGPAIPEAVARGGFCVTNLQGLYPAGEDEFEMKPTGFRGRATMVCADVFDRMRVQSIRKGGKLALTPGQIEMGRLYARTVERHRAGAVRCSSVEAMPSGSGGNADGFTEARLASARRIDLWHRRIGDWQAMEVKRVRKRRPSSGLERVGITARALVDHVCLEDLEISKVLRRHGWAVKGEAVKTCTIALGAILDRMAGPVRTGDIKALRTDLPADIWGRG